MEENRKLRVLCIEDDASLSRILQKRLERLGHEVVIAETGEAGIAACDEGAFDVVALDYALPLMSGLDVLRVFATRDSAPPVVMVTGQGNEQVAVEAMKLGAVDYVAKDHQGTFVELLEGALERACQHRRLEENMVATNRGLIESEQRVHAIFENSVDGLLVASIETRAYHDANPAMCRMLGYSLEEILNLQVESIHPAEALPHVLEQFEKMVKGETCVADEVPVLRKDGSVFYANINVSHIVLSGEAFLVGSFRDITERKRLEEERLKMERQILHSQKLESLGVLAGGIAHDFNNILMAVLGYADLAMMDLDETHPALASVREIEKGARRAADLTHQMLAYSGRGRFVIEALDVSALIDDIAHLLRTSIPKIITLNLNVEDSLPPIDADAAQMQQIVMNLLANASEAIGEGPGLVTLSTGRLVCTEEYLAQSLIPPAPPEEVPEPGLHVYFEVSDTGCGIDEETRARIFEPFFTTKFMGRGLGMAAVLGIVRGHKGAIMLDSVVGKGSTFRVLFPVVEGKHADDAADTGDRTQHGTVLVIDDEESVRLLTRAMLERQGFKVLCAADGIEGVEVFRDADTEIACVILDLTMPRMDGEACFEALRQIKEDVRVILASGYNEQELSQRYAGRGLAGFIQKPFNKKELKEKLTEVLGGKQCGPKGNGDTA